jgi:hypothetical protein
MMGLTPSSFRQICKCQSLKDPNSSTALHRAGATTSISISYEPQAKLPSLELKHPSIRLKRHALNRDHTFNAIDSLMPGCGKPLRFLQPSSPTTTEEGFVTGLIVAKCRKNARVGAEDALCRLRLVFL